MRQPVRVFITSMGLKSPPSTDLLVQPSQPFEQVA